MRSPREKLEAMAGPAPVALAWLGLPSPAAASIAAGAGFAAAVIDREHGTIGVESAAAMIMALRAEGAAALVRVPELSKGAVQHALDAGAAGIVVPQVESVEEARMAARAVYYAPQGSRGAAAAVIAATGYGRDPGYLAEWNARGLLAVQIESREGLARVDEIAAVEGVDMLFFGPFDYAQDAGLDPSADAPALAEVFARIVEAARGADCLAGVFPWPGIGGEALSDMGADAIARASDIAVLRQGMSAALGHH